MFRTMAVAIAIVMSFPAVAHSQGDDGDEGGDVGCKECRDQCPSHYIWFGTGPSKYPEHNFADPGGSGCIYSYFESCGLSCDIINDDDQLNQLVLALPDALRRDLRALVESREGIVQFVAERGVIQVTGCGGAVLEQIPLGDLASVVQAVSPSPGRWGILGRSGAPRRDAPVS